MSHDIKYEISSAIQNFSTGSLYENALRLIRALRYPVPIEMPLDDPSWQGLQNLFQNKIAINKKVALIDDWKYFNILFQLTEESMQNMISMFSSGRVDNTDIHSFLFLFLEMKEEHYSKTQLSQITREINKIFAMPAIILFKTGSFLTLAVIHRRIHKKDESKDVLEKVTLIKDISITNPHRAHIEILFDLSFNELQRKYGFTNFVELHQAWQKTLDIKELNKRFFRELFNWYHWAVRNVKFPNEVDDDKDDMQYNQEAVIRLLTRLIFVWFIKEKGLVPEVLFEPKILKDVLKHFNPHSGDSAEYYRAILQNLFFATLNTPMDKDITDENLYEKRGFIEPGMKGGKPNPDYTNQTRYRYKEYFIHEEKALELFATIPFLNGGLFECLDYGPEDGLPELRIDGFSTKTKKQAFVPNALFFADEFIFDLNDEYGTKNKLYKVKGLINIFNGYKFTITENTPLEEEVALDPELLGKVFENLLATYNPETKTTARKQTGSFYTPREIVNYMVDESLKAYLSNKIDAEDHIRRLFNGTDPHHDFNAEESRKLTHALSHCRILDPACGSGAFPMGILHRMVDLLKKLDPDNEYWKEIQKARAIHETEEAYNIGDEDERKFRLDEINKAFDESMNNPDYARKLFLIENCIYGVDIQQIAVQIAKLRFFISLVAEQKVDDSKPNRNILSMPNLETKFVAANTLIALEKPAGQLSLMSMDTTIEKKERELRKLRERIFFTRRYQEKKILKKEEKSCREELKKILIDNDMSKSAAEQMAGWNPFDPLASSPYFDAETMFGIEGGFDILIGNPPYVNVFNIKDLYLRNYLQTNYKVAKNKSDLYAFFIEKGIKLLFSNKHLIFIISNSWLGNNSFINLRRFLLENTKVKFLVECYSKVFDAAVTPVIICVQKINVNENTANLYRYEEGKFLIKNEVLSYAQIRKSTNLPFSFEKSISFQIPTKPLGEIVRFNLGIKTADNDRFVFDRMGDRDFYKVLRGKDIDRFSISYKNKWLWYKPDLMNERVGAGPRKLEYFLKDKILIRDVDVKINAVFDDQKYLVLDTINFAFEPNKEYNLKYLTVLLNSNLLSVWFKRNFPAGLHIKINQLEQIPIPLDFTAYQNALTILHDYITTKAILVPHVSTFLMNIINSTIYELYFPNEINFVDCGILEHLQHLPEIKEAWDEKKKLAVIEQVYRELSDPTHPVSIAMEKMKEVEEVRVIEEAVNGSKGKVKSEE